MATTESSKRRVTIVMSGDFEMAETFRAADNADAPGTLELVTLASGANTITVPTGGATVTGCTIIPPTGNTTNITLKGVTGDTGVQLHDSDPTSLAIDPGVVNFVLTAAAQITGVRLIWT